MAPRSPPGAACQRGATPTEEWGSAPAWSGRAGWDRRVWFGVTGQGRGESRGRRGLRPVYRGRRTELRILPSLKVRRRGEERSEGPWCGRLGTAGGTGPRVKVRRKGRGGSEGPWCGRLGTAGGSGPRVKVRRKGRGGSGPRLKVRRRGEGGFLPFANVRQPYRRRSGAPPSRPGSRACQRDQFCFSLRYRSFID